MRQRRHSKVVIAESFAPRGQAELRERGIEVVSCVGGDRNALARALRDADALIVRSATRVDRTLLELAPRLRVVGRAGAGVDAIDVGAATEAGVIVLNTPAANTLATTELTFALLLALLRNVAPANASVRAGRWERGLFIGSELFGKTLGIVGLGQIGGAVAERARAFGMHVVAHDPFVPEARADALGIELCELGKLLAKADVVTLHVPLGPHTRGMIDAAALRLMQPHAVLVNCARGDLVDEQALIDALDGGTIAAAAIDVVSEEPPPAGSAASRLQGHPKVLATPHLGGSTYEALERIAVDLARDLADALIGHPAAGAVNAPVPSGANAERVRPFVTLADRLGRLMPQLFEDSARMPLRLELGGEMATAEPQPLRAALLAALLQTTSERRVSIANALILAADVGMTLEVVADPRPRPFASVLSLSAGKHRLSGTILEAGPRVIEIDGYEIDVAPQGVWIVTRHDDVPGMVGRAGTILGDAAINIVTMQVSHRSPGLPALMVLAIDRAIGSAELQKLRDLPGMHRVDTAVL